MLHIVYADPSSTNKLDECLQSLKSTYALLLMGDAVQAITMDRYKELLANINNLYLNRLSIQALGLTVWPGTDVGSDELVELIVKHGSPVTWK